MRGKLLNQIFGNISQNLDLDSEHKLKNSMNRFLFDSLILTSMKLNNIFNCP